MSIKKKINKFVDEMPEKKAEEILPQEAFAKPSKNYRWGYSVAGLAAATVVAVAGISAFNKNSGTTNNTGDINYTSSATSETSKDNNSSVTPTSPDKTETGYKDGVIKGDVVNNFIGGSSIYDKGIVSDEISYEVAGEAEPGISDIVIEPAYPSSNEIINAGTLTGGELRDFLNWDNYLKKINMDVLKNWNVLSTERINVYLKNGSTALPGIKTELIDDQKNVIYTAVSDINGNAYLFYNYKKDVSTPSMIRVYLEDGSNVEYALADKMDSKNYLEIQVDENKKQLDLDLMFVVDTTGSMSDELEYLKVEIQDVIERAEKDTGAKIRTSVNFYRDETDEYVVKFYDFRDDAAEVAGIVGEQFAEGGGDFPEAVHKALNNALYDHNWSENSIKLMFIVLDAPPHEENADEIVQLVEKAAQMGVRIIPIMASGADDETVNIFRSYAVMTGGTYLFLDDNSGIGGSHTTPLNPNEYNSEYLNEMIIRVIGEFCGESLDPVVVEQPTKPVQGN